MFKCHSHPGPTAVILASYHWYDLSYHQVNSFSEQATVHCPLSRFLNFRVSFNALSRAATDCDWAAWCCVGVGPWLSLEMTMIYDLLLCLYWLASYLRQSHVREVRIIISLYFCTTGLHCTAQDNDNMCLACNMQFLMKDHNDCYKTVISPRPFATTFCVIEQVNRVKTH